MNIQKYMMIFLFTLCTLIYRVLIMTVNLGIFPNKRLVIFTPQKETFISPTIFQSFINSDL